MDAAQSRANATRTTRGTVSRVKEGAATALGLSTNAADRYLEASKRFQAACVYTPVNWSMREEGDGGAGSYWAEAVAGRVTAGNVEIFDHNKLFTMTMTTTASTMGREDDDDNDDGCACNSNSNSNVQQPQGRPGLPAFRAWKCEKLLQIVSYFV